MVVLPMLRSVRIHQRTRSIYQFGAASGSELPLRRMGASCESAGLPGTGALCRHGRARVPFTREGLRTVRCRTRLVVLVVAPVLPVPAARVRCHAGLVPRLVCRFSLRTSGALGALTERAAFSFSCPARLAIMRFTSSQGPSRWFT